jgi:hypothetical protein
MYRSIGLENMICQNLKKGDLIIDDLGRVAILFKETSKYWHYYMNNNNCRTSKFKLWRQIDKGHVKVKHGSTLKRRKKQKKDRTLDLHGVAHKHAEEAIRKYLNWVSLPTRIITGDSGSMKKIVFSVVEEYGWHVENDASNYGELIIFENKL